MNDVSIWDDEVLTQREMCGSCGSMLADEWHFCYVPVGSGKEVGSFVLGDPVPLGLLAGSPDPAYTLWVFRGEPTRGFPFPRTPIKQRKRARRK